MHLHELTRETKECTRETTGVPQLVAIDIRTVRMVTMRMAEALTRAMAMPAVTEHAPDEPDITITIGIEDWDPFTGRHGVDPPIVVCNRYNRYNRYKQALVRVSCLFPKVSTRQGLHDVSLAWGRLVLCQEGVLCCMLEIGSSSPPPDLSVVVSVRLSWTPRTCCVLGSRTVKNE